MSFSFRPEDYADLEAGVIGHYLITKNYGSVLGGPHNAQYWGAKGDGVADDTNAIQSAIDWAIQNGKQRVWLPGGAYRITKTLQAGWGDSFRSVVIEGDGYQYAGSTSFCGTSIVPDFSDQPCINFQGARGSVVRGISFIGKLYNYISGNLLTDVNTLVDDTVAANWNDPALSPHQESRYAPYAAITIDAYSGSGPSAWQNTHAYAAGAMIKNFGNVYICITPGTSAGSGGPTTTSSNITDGTAHWAYCHAGSGYYPDVTYPAWTAINTQYSKPHSSDILVEDCFFEGFNTCIAVQPCNSDANGDYTNIRRCTMVYCKYGISIGNTQSRSVAIDDVKGGVLYTAIVNNVHGLQSGTLKGLIKNLSVSGMIQVFNLNMVYAGPVKFSHAYVEGLWRLGDISSSTSNECPLTFDSCDFNFTDQNDTRGHPAHVLSAQGQPGQVTMRDCILQGFQSVVGMLGVTSFTTDHTVISSAAHDSGTISHPYICLAHNCLAGGLVLPPSTAGKQDLKFKKINVDTGAAGTAVVMGPSYTSGARAFGLPRWVPSFQAGSDYQDNLIHPRFYNLFAKSGFTSVSMGTGSTGKELTLVFSALSDNQAESQGPVPGDILWDDQTGTTFFVRSRSTTTVIAVAQNNYKSDGAGGWQMITPFSTSVGNIYCYIGRYYTTTYPLIVDGTTGSADLTPAGRDDGYTGPVGEITANDRIFIDFYKDNWASYLTTKMTVLSTAGSGTITLAAAPSRNITRKRIPILIRKPPTNE